MKKCLAMLLVLVMLVGVVGFAPAFAADDDDAAPMPPHIKDGVSVVAIFADAEVNPIEGPEDAPEDMEPIMADAILLYFSDNTFDQYVETPKGFELYSTGTYTFKEEGDFILTEKEGEDVIALEITQQFSIEDQKLVDASEKNEFDLSTIHLAQLFGPDDEREVEAVFADNNAVIYEDENGVISNLDAIWIYYADGTFEEYAFLKGEVVLYGSGTYAFDEAGDFHIVPLEKDNGTITLTWKESLGGFADRSLTFDLGSTGLLCLFEKLDADAMPELPAKAG